MNKEQIIDEAYNNFVTTVENNRPEGYTREVLTQEEFVKNSIIDPYFSKHWGLKIEERELSNKERVKLSWFILFPNREEEDVPEWWNIRKLTMDDKNVPTKLITLTYNNETIESYE
jgi:hypothetical protein